MMSSNDEMEIVAKCMKNGAKDYLIKPIRISVHSIIIILLICMNLIIYFFKKWITQECKKLGLAYCSKLKKEKSHRRCHNFSSIWKN